MKKIQSKATNSVEPSENQENKPFLGINVLNEVNTNFYKKFLNEKIANMVKLSYFNQIKSNFMEPNMINENLKYDDEQTNAFNVLMQYVSMFHNQLQQPVVVDQQTLFNHLNMLKSMEELSMMNCYQSPLFNPKPTHMVSPALASFLPPQTKESKRENSSKNADSHTNVEQKKQFHRKRPLQDLFCSCGSSFESLEQLTLHLRQTNHKVDSCKGNNLDSAHSKPESARGSKCTKDQLNHVIQVDSCSNQMNRMVRGQEEWVSSTKSNNLISQILKCLECSASFNTLAELSLHMMNSKHFSKFRPNMHQPNAHRHNNTSGDVQKNRKISLNSTSPLSPSLSSPTVFSNQRTSKKSRSENCKEIVKCKNKIPIQNQQHLLCSICYKSFNANVCKLPPHIEFIQHLQNAHSIKELCTNCGSIFSSSHELQEHLVNNQSAQITRNKKANIETKTGTINSLINKKNEPIGIDTNCDQTNTKSPSAFSSNSTRSSISPSSSSARMSPDSELATKNNSKENAINHPLLALQMFVSENGQSEMLPNQNEEVTIGRKASNEAFSSNTARLPAKKRPYVYEELDHDSVRLKQKASTNMVSKACLDSKENSETEDEQKKENNLDNKIDQNSSNTVSNKDFNPLNLLQQMHLNFENYF
jgi:hypothetical protein